MHILTYIMRHIGTITPVPETVNESRVIIFAMADEIQGPWERNKVEKQKEPENVEQDKTRIDTPPALEQKGSITEEEFRSLERAHANYQQHWIEKGLPITAQTLASDREMAAMKPEELIRLFIQSDKDDTTRQDWDRRSDFYEALTNKIGELHLIDILRRHFNLE